jgi:hypothetical protein
MADLSNLSDEELTALYNKGSAAATPAPVTTPAQTDLSKMSDDELKAAYAAATKSNQAQPSVAADVAKSAGTGLAKGVLGAGGFFGDVSDVGAKGIRAASDYISNKLGIDPYRPPSPGESPTIDAIRTAVQAVPTEKSLQSAVESQTGKFYEPQTAAGRYTEKAAEFAGNPLSYVGPGGLVGKGISAAGAGLGSEAAGDVADKFAPNSPKTKAALELVGAIAGGHGVAGAPRLVTPNIISPERQAMINTLDQEGVPLTAGDRTGGRMLKATESELSPGRNEPQDRAFRQAAFNRVGETIGDRPIQGQNGAVNSMMNRVGGQFDALASRNQVTADQQLVHDLQGIHGTYNSTPGLYPQETVNSVNGSINRVMNSMFSGGGPGTLSGADYLTLRSNLRRAAQGATDPQRAEGLHAVTNALDDAMERTIQRTNPNDAGAWAQVRRDYRNALVLQDWAGSANMTPATLAQAAKRVYGKNVYTRGTDDFSDLAEAGRNVLKQYPDSGTASRLDIEKAMSNVGGALGHALSAGGGYAAGSHLLGGTEGGVGGLLLGEAIGPFALRPLVQGAVMNPLTQRYLANQRLPYQIGSSPSMQALVNEIGGRSNAPPVPNARKAKDGRWYIPDNSRPGKFIEVRP